MANLTKNVGTVTLTGTAEKVTLPASYGWVWVKNMSEGDIFAGLSEDISEGADGVMTIPAGECGRIQADGFNSVYLLGSGNVQIVGQNYADCPFKAAAKGGELPVASTDVLGGVMVDGTSITADEQGVISAVGSGSGGLTLLGTYTFTDATTYKELFKVDGTNITWGDRLLFELVPNSTSESTGWNSLYHLIPVYVAASAVSRYALFHPYNSSATLGYIRFISNGSTFLATTNVSNLTFKVYKLEV